SQSASSAKYHSGSVTGWSKTKASQSANESEASGTPMRTPHEISPEPRLASAAAIAIAARSLRSALSPRQSVNDREPAIGPGDDGGQAPDGDSAFDPALGPHGAAGLVEDLPGQ